MKQFNNLNKEPTTWPIHFTEEDKRLTKMITDGNIENSWTNNRLLIPVVFFSLGLFIVLVVWLKLKALLLLLVGLGLLFANNAIEWLTQKLNYSSLE